MTEMKEAENAYGARAAVERTFLVGGPMLSGSGLSLFTGPYAVFAYGENDARTR